MKLFNIKLYSYFWICCLLSCIGCRKMVEAPAPGSSINIGNVFSANVTAIGALSSLYSSSETKNINNFYLTGGQLSDEIEQFVSITPFLPYYQNALNSTSPLNPWEGLYRDVLAVNSAIEGINSSTTLTLSIKQQLMGEAKFMRAYYYFYLTNLFGDVPLALTTDPEVNRVLARSPQTIVYAQIEQDLKDAQSLLSKDFLNGTLQSKTSDRVRPTYWAATALLARMYLYKKMYIEAIAQSSVLINNNPLFTLTSINAAFLKNSSETIWALQPLPSGPPFNTPEGATFILPSTGPSTNSEFPFILSNNVVNAFEAGDARGTNWVGKVTVGTNTYSYAFKYKADAYQTPVTEYEIVFRLAEQYLIRAEAEARLGGASNIAAAIADLNVIRTRARASATVSVPNPLPNLPSTLTQTQLYSAIEHERQVELFTEFGHRWLDLKRTPGFIDPNSTRADEVMPTITAAKGGIWSPNWKLLPIPKEQIQQDPNMTHAQNPGYN